MSMILFLGAGIGVFFLLAVRKDIIPFIKENWNNKEVIFVFCVVALMGVFYLFMSAGGLYFLFGVELPFLQRAGVFCEEKGYETYEFNKNGLFCKRYKNGNIFINRIIMKQYLSKEFAFAVETNTWTGGYVGMYTGNPKGEILVLN